MFIIIFFAVFLYISFQFYIHEYMFPFSSSSTSSFSLDYFFPYRLKRTLYSERNMNSLNVEYFWAMNIPNLDKNG